MIKNIIIALLAASLIASSYIANSRINELSETAATIGKLKATISALQYKHKKAILRTKLRERGKRALAVIPVAGLIAVGWFEKQEYEEWKQENPQGTAELYFDEVSKVVQEMSADYYEELKEEYPDLKPLEQILN